ncbi:MAG: transglutaminase domain-containing protein [Actinomycetaceae bacterium]|nr:transglutaminase domain-containing protein [Actinomycetaceae bacterium]
MSLEHTAHKEKHTAAYSTGHSGGSEPPLTSSGRYTPAVGEALPTRAQENTPLPYDLAGHIGTTIILLALLTPIVFLFEDVYGGGAGLRAAGTGVGIGLLIAFVALRWRWDLLSIFASVVSAYLLLGGWAALPTTTAGGFFPRSRTLQLLVLQVVDSWKDALTLAPPLSAYEGPAVLPWLVCLVGSTLAGLLAHKVGALAASVPLGIMALIGAGWGRSGAEPPLWPVALWLFLLLLWWAWSGQKRRFALGHDVRVGKDDARGGASVSAGQPISVVHLGRRILAAALVLACAIGLALPAAYLWGPSTNRIVMRDLVEPPLNVRELPSPLSAFRHYTTDLEEETLLTVSGLPQGARLRFAVLDAYDGTTMRMSPVHTHPGGGYVRAGTTIPGMKVEEGSLRAEVDIHTHSLSGPWVPMVGTPAVVDFYGENAGAQRGGLHVDPWARTALTTGPGHPATYQILTDIAPEWSDGQLAGVPAVPLRSKNKGVPNQVAVLAAKIIGDEEEPLARARAIERYLSQEGFFSNAISSASRPGHRADRLIRMLEAPQLIGDDEQYSVLMALMLQSLGINARVVMGAYPEGQGENVSPIELRGGDIHAWVEVEFEGAGWATFDPTPSQDRIPQQQQPKETSTPRHQVLQPPEPPEEPAELPPATTERGVEAADDRYPSLPWVMIGAGALGLLLFILPIASIVGAKTLRRRHRRRAPARESVLGSWAEVVDMATDAGVAISPDLTRRETADLLSEDLWNDSAKAGQRKKASTPGPSGTIHEVGVTKLSIPAGSHRGTQSVITPQLIAEAADAADFSPEAVTESDVGMAWNSVDHLRLQLRRGTSLVKRVRRGLSLRSFGRRKQGATAPQRGKRRWIR